MKRRTLALLLSVALCLGLAIPALAVESDFTIENGVLTKYNGSGGDVVIPDGVAEIGWYAFYGCESLTSVVIPDSVTRIGKLAFADCKSLTSVVIPDSVIEIESAFHSCTGLTSVTIGNGLTKIGDSAFRMCEGLTSVVIPDSVTEIGHAAFLHCKNLTSVTIGSGVTKIEDNIFRYCDKLTDIYFSGSEAEWKRIDIDKGNEELTKATVHYNSKSPTAQPSTQSVNVDGRPVEFAMYALNGGSVNYIRVRDLAVLLNGTAAQFDVGWDDKVVLTRETAYTGSTDKAPFNTEMPYTFYTERTFVDGWAEDLEAIQIEYNGGGYTYYKLRDLGKALGFNVGWSADKGVYVETDKPYDPNN